PIPRPSHQLPDGFSDTNGGVSAVSPSSPSSPTLPLSSLPVPIPQWSSEESISETVAPSLLSPPPQDAEGLGLFLQPISVDPPLARSLSPDDDDVQLDTASTMLEVDEFLQLCAVCRRALAAECPARSTEAELAERVSTAAKALLPPTHSMIDVDMDMSDDIFNDDTKRLRKHDLHVAMDMRAEARWARKHEKQWSKEVGALLDLKMECGVVPGKGVMRSIAQLVANMVLRRRDMF
ncbi:hypothetical protein C8Q72DRAFT_130985, partial [Fomitopsis betulina]